jgi:hypothetical protein
LAVATEHKLDADFVAHPAFDWGAARADITGLLRVDFGQS